MTPHSTDAMQGFLDWCTNNVVQTLIVGTADTNGSWIGKRVAVRDLPMILDNSGLAFAEGVFTITRDGGSVVQPREGQETYFPRKDNGYPDIFLRPELATARLLSWSEKTAALNGSFVKPDGVPLPIAPRNVLARQTERARAIGLEIRIGFEFEFYLLKGSLADLETNRYVLTPIYPRPYTYMVSRATADYAILQHIHDGLEGAGITVGTINPETGPGQYEINTGFNNAMRAGDDAFLYKNAIKDIAAAHGLLATFMAKPQKNWPGSSCHLHQSLWSIADGEPLTWSPGKPLSDIANGYIAGLLMSMTELAALFAPTVNSYKRLMPYSLAPTSATWGLDNRSTALRVVGGAPDHRRIEHRFPGADVNPYLAIAACLAGGLHGIENNLQPGEPCLGDAYANRQLSELPTTLNEALDIFETSELARTSFGDDFVEHFVSMKRWEAEQHRTHVSDWEVRHYVETA